MSDPRQPAWDGIHDLLPEGWRVSPTSYDPRRDRWTMTAHGLTSGVQGTVITVEGEDDLHALTELVLALRELDLARRMADLERRMRLAFLAGAEEGSRRSLGRWLEIDELVRVVRRYPGQLRASLERP